jgi:type III secretion protein U
MPRHQLETVSSVSAIDRMCGFQVTVPQRIRPFAGGRMTEESEQKSLPASEKKLRDARVKRGQVAHSKDLVAGIGLLVMLGFLFFAWSGIRDRILQLLDAVTTATAQPFAQSSQQAVGVAVEALVVTSLTLAVVVVVTVLAVGMAATGGPIFSFELVKPKFEHINPVQGAKRIFSLRNLVEFAKGIIKIVCLTAAFWLVLRGSLRPLFHIPACGEACLAPVVLAVLQPLAATAAIVFVVIGLVDVLLQRQLFLRDMRMTRTEYKREQKDMEGDPLIRRERRRIHRRVLTSQVRTGLRHAVIVVAHGDEIVGVRYRAGETPIPMVVSKGRGEVGRRQLAEARELGIPVVDNAALAAGLAAGHKIGDMIQREFFVPVAEILFKSKRT